MMRIAALLLAGLVVAGAAAEDFGVYNRVTRYDPYFRMIGYRIFDRMTPFDTSRQLQEKNVAVGIVVGSIFVGLGVSVGLVIGLGLN